MCIPEGEEKEEGAENLFKEIIAENFSNLGRKLDVQVHEARRTHDYFNAKRPSPRYIIMKLSKIKDKYNLKTSKRKKVVNSKRTSIRLSVNFSAETL